jgi:outer membrane lipoprotein carrier protein
MADRSRSTFRPGPSSSHNVRALALSLACCIPVLGRDLGEVLKAVERRYNSARSLEIRFEQSYRTPGRGVRVESGLVSLQKPGRMRWQYTNPAGKLLVSDGKWMWFYSPAANQVEKSRLKDLGDFRAPLAFLLGRLDFRKEFRDLALDEANGEAHIAALPARDGLPYQRVEFWITPANSIRRLRVEGLDRSSNEFLFDGERIDANLAGSLFRFTPPAGVAVVEVAAFGEKEGKP